MNELSSRRQSAAAPLTRTALSCNLFLLTLLAMACLYILSLGRSAAQTPTPVTVPTWRYDLTHAGQNTNETALTPSNVAVSTFGKLFSLTVDGSVYPQPLYVPSLTMNDGLIHNVLFVATEHDSIYAFDADSNGGANANPLWHITLLDGAHGAGSGATTVPWKDEGSEDMEPEIGITGTPVINPATNTMYVVGASKENGAYFLRLHAINILTGAERTDSPVEIKATVTGTGTGSSGGKLSFSPLWQNQRGALDYYNGHVYFAFGSHGDNGPWHGWVFAYDATTLAQTAVFCTSPNGLGAGVWEAGAGLPIDDGGANGRLFLTTGNGTFTTYPPFNESSELGDSIVDFDLSNGGLTPTDAFTSFNQATLSKGDADQGSGGILMVPDQQGANPHILVQVGKEGRILVLNRDHLGGYLTGVTSNTNALQDITNEIKGLWSTPAYWNGNVYMWPSIDVPKLFKLNSGVMNTTPSSKGSMSSTFPGASFSISSDGAQDGIAWAVRSDQYTTHGTEVLYAFDATNLSNLLYESDTNASRDSAGRANKFSIPVVTNGKVYVAAYGLVDVYGLFNDEPATAAPSITPNGGTFTASQSVTLASATSSANIFYSLDGSVPTPGSTRYSEPIAVSTDTTLNAIASAPGFIQSPMSTASFTFSNQTPAISVLPAAGTYTSTQQVTLSDTDSSAKIYYTTDGSAPTASSLLYTGQIAVSSSITINAIAIDPNLQNSNVVDAAYVIQSGGVSIDFGSGFASVSGLTLNGSTVSSDDSRLQLTNGQEHEAGSVFWNQPIGVQAFTTDFSFQLSQALADGFTFTIQNVGPTALGGQSASLGYAGIKKSVAIKFDLYNNAGEGTDSTGVYSNGATPTLPAVDMTSSGVLLRSGDSMEAHLTYDGTTLTMNLEDLVNKKTFTLTKAINIPQIVGSNTAWVGFTGGTGGESSSQKILDWTYTAQAAAATAATPSFTPAAGSYSAAQNVALSSTTAGAKIYYTTNGTTPTTASTAYSSPIAVGTGTTTIEAIAVASGLSQSAVASAKYVIGTAATPVINFTSFPSTTGLSLTNAATVTNNVLQVTLEGSSVDKGSAWFNQPVNVSAFTTDFQFQLLNGTADGFTFTIQNDSLTAIGPGGSGLGYGASKPGATLGLAKSVAVKFDLYSNQGEGTDSIGFYTDGASPTIPATDMTASGVILRSGHVFHAHITYDGTNLTLVLTDTTNNASFTKTAAINIPSTVGADTAYVGFTGGTGGLSMTTQILNWTLTNP